MDIAEEENSLLMEVEGNPFNPNIFQKPILQQKTNEDHTLLKEDNIRLEMEQLEDIYEENEEEEDMEEFNEEEEDEEEEIDLEALENHDLLDDLIILETPMEEDYNDNKKIEKNAIIKLQRKPQTTQQIKMMRVTKI